MFIGYYQLGDLLPISVWTLNANSLPVEPDDAPVVHIIDSSNETIYANTLPAVDSANVTGYFLRRVNLDQSFAAGYYSVIVNYVVGSNPYVDVYQFEIAAGGDDEGNGLAIHFFKQPAADYLLLQTDRGSLKRLKNPAVRGA